MWGAARIDMVHADATALGPGQLGDPKPWRASKRAVIPGCYLPQMAHTSANEEDSAPVLIRPEPLRLLSSITVLILFVLMVFFLAIVIADPTWKAETHHLTGRIIEKLPVPIRVPLLIGIGLGCFALVAKLERARRLQWIMRLDKWGVTVFSFHPRRSMPWSAIVDLDVNSRLKIIRLKAGDRRWWPRRDGDLVLPYGLAAVSRDDLMVLIARHRPDLLPAWIDRPLQQEQLTSRQELDASSGAVADRPPLVIDSAGWTG